MKNLKIEIHKGPGALNNLAEEWAKLESDKRWGIYSRPEWFLAWWKTFGRRAKLITITARTNGHLLGVLPVCQRRTDKRGLFFRITEPLSGADADYHCPVIKTGWEAKVLPSMLEKAWDAFGRSGTFIWPNVPTESAALPVIRELIKRNNLLSLETKSLCPQLFFAKDYSSTEKLWKRTHRKEIRRRRRRLAERGKVALKIISTKNEMKQLLPELFQVHDQKWHSQGLPAKFNDPLIRQYYYNLVDCLGDKRLHFSILMCDGIHVSFQIGFFSDGWLLLYKPTYRIEYHNCSPNKVHMSYLIEEGIREGLKGFDFLQGDEAYKLQWTNAVLETVSFITGFNKSSPSYFWFSSGKPLAKKKFQFLYYKLKAKKEKWLR